jgi:hypothetical protein
VCSLEAEIICMTGKMRLVLFVGLLMAVTSSAQKPAKQPVIDTSFSDVDYDDLFNEFDLLLDSLTQPRNFGFFNIAAGYNWFSSESKETFSIQSRKRFTFLPTLSYYFKNGLGVSASSVVVNDGQKINPYQYNVTGSYDYIKNSKFITGISLTHFFTRDSLPFYTSPLKNALYSYFTYRASWIKPAVGVSYGWGSRSAYQQREEYITTLRLSTNGFTRINTTESINDLNLIGSVRHDFYWLDVLGKRDYVRFTPQVVFVSGTQKFGFNQTSSTYATLPRTGANVLYSTDNVALDDQLYFQPLSLSTYLKAEYSKGNFFFQPQLIFDYYFPADDKKLTTAIVFNAGVIF